MFVRYVVLTCNASIHIFLQHLILQDVFATIVTIGLEKKEERADGVYKKSKLKKEVDELRF